MIIEEQGVCEGWKRAGWYCLGGHPLKVIMDGISYTHACPTWPSKWRHPIQAFMMGRPW